jgi:hypothetical protein
MKVAFEEKLWKLGRGFGGCLSSWVLSILRPILNEISCLYFCSWHIGKTLWFWILYIKFSCQYYIKVNQNFYTIYFKNQNTFTTEQAFHASIYVSIRLFYLLFSFWILCTGNFSSRSLNLTNFNWYRLSSTSVRIVDPILKPVQLVMTGLKNTHYYDSCTCPINTEPVHCLRL